MIPLTVSNEEKRYHSPFSTRYASDEMSYLFSPYFKYLTWRKLWIALAKAQRELGIPISAEQIESMEKCFATIDLARVMEYEKLLKHDVMAHIHAFGDECPSAKGIIHLGATSSYVTDNGDLIQIRDAMQLLRSKMALLLRHFSIFAKKYAHTPTLSYTHLQAAQPTSVGKRACLWMQDFLIDFEELERFIETMRFLGVKGATGTQASFLTLFAGSHQKVKKMEERVCKEMGFSRCFSISGQTYTRKQDICLLQVLAGFAASAHKFATDIRLLCHLKEIEEPFAEKQVGSSAMPYKRNPMRSERICGLARFLLSLQENPLYTQATQWLERTLDDSSNRRLYLPEAFLAADALLNLLIPLVKGLIVHPKTIEKHLREELPFLITEALLMEAVKKGKDRQQVHERLRLHSIEAGRRIKEEGEANDLFDRIEKDASIGLSRQEIATHAAAGSIMGRSAEQVEEFLEQEISPLLNKYAHLEDHTPEILV
jgi:adenylosuccinate lyase